MLDLQHTTWIERYRPHTIDECILPETLKKTFIGLRDSNEIPNLLLAGTSGVGKTTVARALLDEIDCEYMIINGSLQNGIDVLRNEISNFAETIPLFKKGRKFVILDEGDYLNQNSIQPALRNYTEEFSRNCGFIMTCNYKHRIIAPLRSRFSLIDFGYNKNEVPYLQAAFFKRLEFILQAENVEYDKKALMKFITKNFPDMRLILNELQRMSKAGPLGTDILVNTIDASYDALISSLKNKKFTEMRKWVGENENIDFTTLMTVLYQKMDGMLHENSIPEMIILCNDYQYKSSFVASQSINTAAFLTEVMARIEFK